MWPWFTFAIGFKFELTMAHVTLKSVTTVSQSTFASLMLAGCVRLFGIMRSVPQKHRRARFCYGRPEEPEHQTREPMTADHNDCPSKGVQHSTWLTGGNSNPHLYHTPCCTAPYNTNHCQQRTEYLLGPAPQWDMGLSMIGKAKSLWKPYLGTM